MSSARLSHSKALSVASNAFATIFIGFGLNAIVRPEHALTFFEFEPPAAVADKKLVDSLMTVYGARDVFMGAAMYAAVWSGDRKTLGLLNLAASAVAFVDGLVCWQAGRGEWNHWGYAPMVAAVGSLLLGVADRARV